MSGELTPEVAASPDSILSMLPDELKSEKSLAKFKDVAALAKSYLHAEKTVGSSIRIPAEDADTSIKQEFLKKLTSVKGVVKLPETDEERTAFKKAIGVPDSINEYKFNLPEELHKAANEKTTALLTELHAAGVSNSVAEPIIKKHLEELIESQKSESAKVEETKKQLETLFGKDLEIKLNQANSVTEILNNKLPGFKEFVQSQQAKSPAVTLMLTELAKNMREPTSITGQNIGAFGTNKHDAELQLQAINGAGADHPRWNNRHPGHKDAVNKYMQLQSILAGIE